MAHMSVPCHEGPPATKGHFSSEPAVAGRGRYYCIITKPFPATPPFGFYGDILELVYSTPSCGAMVSARSRKPAISIETIDHRR